MEQDEQIDMYRKLIHDYLSDDLSSEDQLMLETWLAEEDSHLDIFREELLLHAHLEELLSQEEPINELLSDQDAADDSDTGTTSAAATTNRDLPLLGNTEGQGYMLRSLLFATFATGALSLVVAWNFLPLGKGQLNTNQMTNGFDETDNKIQNSIADNAEVEETPSHTRGIISPSENGPLAAAEPLPGIASAIEQKNCVWHPEYRPNSDERILQGQHLELISGKATLRFDNGARLQLEGVARLSADSITKVSLELGEVVAYVPDEAKGFIVETDDLQVRDLGTAFSVGVNSLGRSRIEVLEGEVETFSVDQETQATEGDSSKVKLLEGEAFLLDALERYANASPSRTYREIRTNFRDPSSLNLFDILQDNPSLYSLDPENGTLTITPVLGSFYSSAQDNRTRPILHKGQNHFMIPVQDCVRDYDIVLQVDAFEPNWSEEDQHYHIALVVMQDEENHARLLMQQENGKQYAIAKILSEKDGIPQHDAESRLIVPKSATKAFFIRMMRKDNELTAWWSSDGEVWERVGSVGVDFTQRHVGFYTSLGYYQSDPPGKSIVIKSFSFQGLQ